MCIICLHYLVEGGRKVIVEGATHTNWVSLMDRVLSMWDVMSIDFSLLAAI